MKFLRLTAALLALSTVFVFSACSRAPSAGTETSSAGSAAETEAESDSLEARKKVSDGLGEADYGGQTFIILCDQKFTNYITNDGMTGDVINDAVYNRNAAVGERFNIKFEKIVYGEGDTMKFGAASILAGDDAFQLISNHIVYLGINATNDYLLNWYSVPHIDFSRDWWSDSTVNDLTYQGKAFIAIGDFAVSAVDRTYCMFYNKVMAENYNLPDIYGVVNDGKWTIEELTALTAGTYSDLNGNNKRDAEDFYGFSSDSKSNVNAYLWAFGKRICTKTDDDRMEITYYDEKLVDIVDRVYGLLFENDCCYTDSTTFMLGASMFYKEKALFCNGYFGVAVTTLRDFKDDFGIIPYPKWDEAQTGYQTMVDGDHEGLAIPVTVRDADYVGTIVEALCAEGWRTVIPAYYDVALKYKYTRDQQSIDLLDMILAGRVFDFGYVYGGWGCAFWIQYLMEKKSKDISSFYTKNESAFSKSMDKVFQYFDNYEG